MFAEMPAPELPSPEVIPATSCPEQRLWRAVLLQVLDDAQAWRQQRFTQKTPQCHALDAHRMVTGNTADFRRICELAGIEADRLREALI
ncbi:hypothetical protein FQZ97_906750 [compost metagenome]